jgi:ABC-type multidrug transport system fused ATPase/permease subunit
MSGENLEQTKRDARSFEPPSWYFILVLLALLSLFALNRNAAGEWEIAVRIGEITVIIVALALLPFLLRFLVRETKGGTVKIAGVAEFSWERKHEIDQELAEKREKHKMVGEAAKAQAEDLSGIEEIQRNADARLEKAIAPQEYSIVQQIYLQELDERVKDFNRNRHLRSYGKGTAAEGDEIAYKMRSIVPLLYGQLDVRNWLHSLNPGKRLAAIKYLDWAKDVEFVDDLLDLLLTLQKDTFLQYHILMALANMADQIAFDSIDAVRARLSEYSCGRDTAREYWKNRILEVLPERQ